MVQPVRSVPWRGHPHLPSALSTPGEVGSVGPLHGRHDEGEGMPADAQPTPAATTAPEEVPTDVVPGEVNGEGPV